MYFSFAKRFFETQSYDFFLLSAISGSTILDTLMIKVIKLNFDEKRFWQKQNYDENINFIDKF